MKAHPPELRERAAELRSHGHGYNSIARAVGISNSTVIRWLDPTFNARQLANCRATKERYRGVCEECGGPTSGCNGPGTAARYCAHCAPGINAIWTRESVVEAIRYFAERYGQPPSAQKWSPSLARQGNRDDLAERFYEDGCWPHTNSVLVLFGSWNAAIAAAGFTPRRPGQRGPGVWSAESIIAALLRQPRQPSFREWRQAGIDHPCHTTVQNVFGSWTAMLEAAGLERLPSGRPKKVAA